MPDLSWVEWLAAVAVYVFIGVGVLDVALTMIRRRALYPDECPRAAVVLILWPPVLAAYVVVGALSFLRRWIVGRLIVTRPAGRKLTAEDVNPPKLGGTP